MKQKITFDVFYPHPPERIWRALTDPAALERWLMPADFRPRIGHRFRFREPEPGSGTGTVRCEVVALEEPCRLAYTWQSERDPEPTLVTWILEPVEGGTRLQLEHIALEGPASLVFQSEARANWNLALSSALPAALSRDRSAVRPRGSILLPNASQPVRCVCRDRQTGIVRKEQIHATHR